MTDYRVGGEFAAALRQPSPPARVGGTFVAVIRQRFVQNVDLLVGSTFVAVARESAWPDLQVNKVMPAILTKPDPELLFGSTLLVLVRNRFSSLLQWTPGVYDFGLDRGVLYPPDHEGVAWNGLISVEESPAGASANSYYFEGVKYLHTASPGYYQATLTAFGAPRQFAALVGDVEIRDGIVFTRQGKKQFSMTYRSKTTTGYKIHLVYNVIATPTVKPAGTITEKPDLTQFSWLLDAVPVNTPDMLPSAHFVVDSREIAAEKLQALEDILYGSSNNEPSLPPLETVIELIS